MKEALIYLDESGKLLPKGSFVVVVVVRLCLIAGRILVPDKGLNCAPYSGSMESLPLGDFPTGEVPKEIIFEFRFRDGEQLARQR